jgi:hypothetical protein
MTAHHDINHEGAEPTQTAEPVQPSQPVAQPDSRSDTSAAPAGDAETLFAENDLHDLRSRWDTIQAAFVDDPKACVHKADDLVSDVVEQLHNGFSAARSRLEEQWSRGEQATTEDLRQALTQYRDFFQRLLKV